MRSTAGWLGLMLGLAVPLGAAAHELPNGIRLPEPWPPKSGATDIEPMRPPYLASPPEVIPIDLGRQLLVDDFLIQETSLRRTFHTAEYVEKNPVLVPDRPWEQSERGPTAMVFSDGVWFDPQDQLFKMWYMGGYLASTCYATSKDGLTWEKPSLDVVPGTNIVLPEPKQSRRDSSTVWLDQEEKDPARRFKLLLVARRGKDWVGYVHVSPDGIHWSEPLADTGPLEGDRTTFFYNPFLRKWVYSVRCALPHELRWRSYVESDDLLAGALAVGREAKQPRLWIGADKNDPPRADLKVQPQLYNLDAVAYESLVLGLFSIWPGQPQDRAKPNYICLGFSRDGFHWDRPDHRPFIDVSETSGAWNWANVQSAGGGCLIVGDRLYFYVSGRQGVQGSKTSGVSTTGLAVLRRDGFASLDAGDTTGTLTTRPVRFQGKQLFVNLDAPEGELRVEVLGRDGKVLEPFSRENCRPLRKLDSTRQVVAWQGASDLSALGGEPVVFRFHLTRGRLYAFWVSPDLSGASHGYVAAGGPGFTGPRDTVGRQGDTRVGSE